MDDGGSLAARGGHGSPPSAAERQLFDGVTFDAHADGPRLNRQLSAVRDLMRDGEWRTLAEIACALGIPEASASARLRDLRKPRFGSNDVQRRRRGVVTAGCWEYRVVLREVAR